jgi:hypothetical protein
VSLPSAAVIWNFPKTEPSGGPFPSQFQWRGQPLLAPRLNLQSSDSNGTVYDKDGVKE